MNMAILSRFFRCSAPVLGFALLITSSPPVLAVEQPAAQNSANSGMDIIFDGDKLMTPDPTQANPQPIMLQGEVQESAPFTAPNIHPILRYERPMEDTRFSKTAIIPKSLFGSDSLFNQDHSAGTPAPRPRNLAPSNQNASADDIAAYLRKMRSVLQNYQTTAMADIFHGGSRVNMQNVNAGQVRGESLGMISEINSIVPPAVLAQQHYQLGSALSAIRNLLSPSRENPLAEIGRIGPAMSYLNQTMKTYHSAVENVIAQYRLSQSLDPLGNESQEDNMKLQGAFNDLSQQLMQRATARNSGGSYPGGGAQNALSNGGGGGEASALQGLLGSAGAALGGSSGGGGGQGLGSLLNGAGGGLGNLSRMMNNSGNGSGSEGAQDSNPPVNLNELQGSLNSLQQLMQSGN
jgi:hypothetical protein